MATSTSDQTSLSDQANSSQQTTSQPDNTAIMAQLIRMTEIVDAMRSDLNAMMNDAATYSTQQSTPPAPQEAPKEEDEQLLQQAIVKEDTEITAEKQEQEPWQQPLYQATVEDVTEITVEKQEQQPLHHEETRPQPLEDDAESTMETTTKYGNSMLDSKTTISTIPRLCTTPTSGDSAACANNAPLFAHQHALNLAYQHTMILGLMLNTPLPGYIQHSQSMEARGEG